MGKDEHQNPDGTEDVASSADAASTDSHPEDAVTSAPPSEAVGSLLSDLLDEAKGEADDAREALDRQLRERSQEHRRAPQREQAKRRQAMQEQLQEETRRRNAALARAEREEAEAALTEEEVVIAHEPPARSKAPMIFLVIFLMAGGGAAAYVALNPPPPIPLPDIQAEAARVLESTRATWRA